MSHLTDGQCEDILHGSTSVPEHVAGCAICRARLEEKRAIAERVRRALGSIEAPPALAEQIRARIAAARGPSGLTRERVRIIPLYIRRHALSGLAAVAAIVICALAIEFYVDTGAQANAAQVALAGIHHANLDSLGQLVSSDDPRVLRDYLGDRVGHNPAMMCTGSGLNMCGCCVRQFQGRPVASYVVRSERTPISVIAVPEPPEALGMTPTGSKTASGGDFWQAKCGCCRMASVRIGGYSYCAVGDVPQEELAAVLGALLQ
jgi:anti-sigma factor RsiW